MGPGYTLKISAASFHLFVMQSWMEQTHSAFAAYPAEAAAAPDRNHFILINGDLICHLDTVWQRICQYTTHHRIC